MLPFLDDDTVLLVQQWRYLVERTTWEMPAGGVHAGEPLADAAQRELAEEVGAPGRAPGAADLVLHLEERRRGDGPPLRRLRPRARRLATPDSTEFLRCEAFPFATLLDMVWSGEIIDSMTIAAALWVDRQRRVG